jgi:hypothetical protein
MMREAINDGKRYAKEIGFDITNINHSNKNN